MTRLDNRFIEDARKKPVKFDHGDHEIIFESTDDHDESEPGAPRADLKVVLGETVIGYITPYTDEEHGVISADQFGEMVPPTFRTVEGALEQLLPGVADGLATPTFVE